jgi:hypothetical protein
MVSFLVEAYLPATHANRLDDIARQLHLAAEEVSRSGSPVSFLRYTYLPADELCLLVFESGSAEVVDAVVERAGIRFERITPALEAQTDRRPEPA